MTTPLRIAAALIPSVEVHTLYLARTATLGEIARHLSMQVKTGSDPAHTLEWAHPVMPAHRLDEIDIQGGDRLLIIMRPPMLSPAALIPGAAALTITAGKASFQSGGKARLLIGKADPLRSLYPEIDVTALVDPKQIDYVSRTCALLEFAPGNNGSVGAWKISKAGVTRVLLDDFEVGAEPVPLHAAHQIRLYRAGDDPRRANSAPILTLHAQVEETTIEPGAAALTGDHPVLVGVGYERLEGRVNADVTVSTADLTARVAEFHHVSLPHETEVYRLRLLSPSQPISAIRLGSEDFLYYPAPGIVSPLATLVE
ncbi:MAG: hypothetical protein U0670_02615 [Anaerolineae bacterium]